MDHRNDNRLEEKTVKRPTDVHFGIWHHKVGVFMLSIFTTYHYVIVGHEFSVTEFLIDGLIWMSAGAILGICLWKTTDHYFDKYSKPDS